MVYIMAMEQKNLMKVQGLTGEWRNGESHGQITMIYLDGKTKEVIYDKENNTFVDVNREKDN